MNSFARRCSWWVLAGLPLILVSVAMVIKLWDNTSYIHNWLHQSGWSGVIVSSYGGRSRLFEIDTGGGKVVRLYKADLSVGVKSLSIGDSLQFIPNANLALIKPNGYEHWIRCKKYDDD